MKGRILIIAGSDSGGGAGIQGDIKTVSALGGYAMTAITAITVQNTVAVSGVHPVPTAIIDAQMRVVFDDLGADAIKTGMLHDAAVIETVANFITEKAMHVPSVIDPVMISKSGNALLHANAINALKEKLLPLTTLITPNIPEAQALLGHAITNMQDAARELAQFGSRAVLLKGGHAQGDVITDVLWDGKEIHEWQSPRIVTPHTHGTGCTLASAIAVSLGQGLPLKESISRARDYVIGAIKHAPSYGHGHGPLNHSWNNR
ncbi:MAG: bifunctional hydroxymethylpyrimidine kinase/phosphomethylpyrimidine kinase [Alphaproteobacteria bacterium]|nr:bifunctional hydroxymethylpyrimidine kinase/phosphomethylpyrimidine kinase [Alphaproteobacteria bacterium]